MEVYFFLGPLLAIGGFGAVLVLLPPFLDIYEPPFGFRLGQEGQRRFGFGELAGDPAVRPQRVRRGLLVRVAVRLISEQAQVVDQRLERAFVIPSQQSPGAGLQGSLFSRLVWGAVTRLSEGSPLLAARHLVATPTRVTAPARPVVSSTTLLKTRRAVHRLVAAGLEGHLGLLATARASRAEHLALASSAR